MRNQKLNPEDVKRIIDNTGIKRKAFCKLVRLPPRYLSEYLNGWRALNDEQLARIETGLEKIKSLL